MRRAIGVLLVSISAVAFAPHAAAQANAHLSGTYHGTGPNGQDETVSFDCLGAPTCSGTYTTVARFGGCTNFLTFSGAATITGVSLGQSGAFSGTFTLAPGNWDSINSNGICSAAFRSGSASLSYSATYDAAKSGGTLTVVTPDGPAPFTFTASTQSTGTSDVLVTGSLDESGPLGYDEHTTISCRGIPTCSGTYQAHVRHENCSNYIEQSGTVVFSGLNLLQSGSISGTLTSTAPDTIHQADGTCAPSSNIVADLATYTGTWDLATGTGVLNLTGSGGANDRFTIRIKADISAPPPIFPLTVNAQIGPVTSTVTADLRFRAQDVGRVGGVYVFAAAPSTRVRGGLKSTAVNLGTAKSFKADAPPTQCVLAQLTPTGLQAVSIAQLQAFVTGAFSAAGQAISILNGTPTPSVAGATFYVGYGATSSAMINDGIFRNAVLIPGDSVCPPLPYLTSLWWNPAESGWGLNLSQQGGIMFATLFTYDASRAPMWLVMPAGAMQTDGLSFAGDLYRTTGPAFNANPFTPIGPANITKVGTMSVAFTEANAGRLNYTVNGIAVDKAIQRQAFGTRPANCLPTTEGRDSSTNYQDLWYNAAESGWGINITHQDNTIFATLFTYDASGRGLWLVMSSGARQADGSYFGDLYRTTGPAFNTVPFPPISAGDVTLAGNMRLRFSDGNNGTLTYTYNGATVTKAITRQVFSTPTSACN